MPRPVHLVGIAGTGMSALAEALLDAGEAVTGSDRFLDAEEPVPALAALRAQGVALFPQDGSGVTPATARVVAAVAALLGAGTLVLPLTLGAAGVLFLKILIIRHFILLLDGILLGLRC